MACNADIDEIMPFIKAFASLVRRRPFLVQRLEEVLKKFLTSLEFFDDAGRKRIAIGAFCGLPLVMQTLPRVQIFATVTFCSSVSHAQHILKMQQLAMVALGAAPCIVAHVVQQLLTLVQFTFVHAET